MTTDKAFSFLLKWWKIIVVWFIAFALYWFANEYADTVWWVWVFALVGAYWVSALILTSEWKVTTSKVIISVIIGLVCIWWWRKAYQEHLLKPSYAMVSDTTGAIVAPHREPTADENKTALIAEWLSGNMELNKKIFYLNSIAENIGIHKYDDTYWIGNEKTRDDITQSVDLRKEWTDQYFEKLVKDNGIDLGYANMMRSDIIGNWVLESREYACFHNNEVYQAYLIDSEYKQRLREITQAQDKEWKEVRSNIERKAVVMQCSMDY